MASTPAVDRVTAYLEGQVVYRRVDAIARYARCSPSTVRKALAQLAAQGRIATVRSSPARPVGYLLVPPPKP